MTIAQDGDQNDELLRRVRFEVNEAAGIYPAASLDA
jgi:hypothetical protein